MPADTGEKIQIQWDDLKTRKVDQRLREQEALERNRRQAEMNPVAADIEAPAGASLWYNAIFTMAVFGLLGGLLAWGGGELLRFRPNPDALAKSLMSDVRRIMQAESAGRFTAAEAESAIDELKREGAGNPYFAVYVDSSLSNAQRDTRRQELDNQEAWKNFIANVLSFGLCGMLIATCLSIAEPIVDHNKQGAIINGCVGAVLGLVGGVVVSLFVDRLYNILDQTLGKADGTPWPGILSRSVTWGVLGLFLTIGPGIVMRNGKKLVIGVIGGLIGGLVGGALFDPVASATGDNAHLGRLVALLAIGVVAGASTGLIENAAKSGWLKVTAGLIAGKQFILYRNPTFIGSGPECQIYLFKDSKVGRRHAALHIVAGGFELENLPLGATTFVNGKPVERARLRNGDKIQIGATSFSFQEKVKE